MFFDARSMPAGAVIETDICVVGGGAAGIAIAREFTESSLRVALLDSGPMDFDASTQDLYAGGSDGHPCLDLTTGRLRYFGGTTNDWGGWSLPLEPIDFESHDGLPYRGW